MSQSVQIIIDRLKKGLNLKTDLSLASHLGVKPNTISAWKKRNSINYELIFAKCANIRKDWLLTGEGEMYADKEKESPKPEKATEEDRLTAIENELKQLKKDRLTPPELVEQAQIPLYQHAVSAGPPCIVSEEVEEYISVPKKIIKHPRETFAVRASGDSMKGADIQEGDIIICDARGTVKTGSIVVASVDGAQTLKKIVLKQGTVTLEPANHNHTTIAITDNSDLAILGVVIALFRIMP